MIAEGNQQTKKFARYAHHLTRGEYYVLYWFGGLFYDSRWHLYLYNCPSILDDVSVIRCSSLVRLDRVPTTGEDREVSGYR